MTSRAAHIEDSPSLNLKGWLLSERSAYAHRSITPSPSTASLSNPNAAAEVSICPVTGPSPSGRGYQLVRSGEYRVAASASMVGRAPPGLAGSTKITWPRPEEQSSCTCRGRAFADLATQKVRPIASQSASLRPKITPTSSPACAPITLMTHCGASSASSSSDKRFSQCH